jgi:hypothetical protein
MPHVYRGTAVLLTVCLAATVEGQSVGGLIKRTVREATKPKEEQAGKQGTDQQGPFVITPARMAAFQRGLEIEVPMHEAFRKRIEALKPQAEWDRCAGEVSMSEEAQKLDEEWFARAEKAKTPEESTRLMQERGQAQVALQVKKCGESRRNLVRSSSDEFEKARKAAVVEFAKSLATVTAHDRGAYELYIKYLMLVCPLSDGARSKARAEGLEHSHGGEGPQFLQPADVRSIDSMCPTAMPFLKRMDAATQRSPEGEAW